MVTLTSIEDARTSATPDARQQLMQMAMAYVPCQALWVATELKIADLLAAGPQPVSALARQTGSNEDALYRILRLLAMTGFFTETQPRHFALTPATDLLRSDHPHSARDFVLWIADPFHFNVSAELMHSVQTGEPSIEHFSGMPAFDYFPTNQVEFDRFHRAMTTMSALAIGPVLEVYDFSPFSIVVDVAGGHGFVICEILRRHPHLKGMLFDLENVVGGAEHRICQLALDGRCRTVAGDFFKSVPEGGDLYLMKHIIHDWDDDRAIRILQNCRRAMSSNRSSKLILIEFVVPEGNEPHPSKVIDIEMLFFPGGRERTEKEWRGLLQKSGFRMTRIIPTQSPFSVVEAEVD